MYRRRMSHMRGLGDYSVITPSGARISYGGTDPNTTPPTPPTPTADSWGAGTAIPAGASLSAGPYELKFQTDGNLVLYNNGKAQWASGTWNKGKTAALTSDGNLVISDGSGKTVWSSGTSGNAGASLQLQADGAFGIFSSAGDSLWGNGPTTPIVPTPTTSTAASTTTTAQPSSYIPTTPTYSATLEPGATYNAATGQYINPDGTVYSPAAGSSTVDLTSPSTWPTWVWAAAAAVGAWALFFRGGGRR